MNAKPTRESTSRSDEADPSASATGLSDSPIDKNGIGFGPYVRAMCRFLRDPNTKPPLTISVEGRWGSGKSSFLLHIATELRSLSDSADREEFNFSRMVVYAYRSIITFARDLFYESRSGKNECYTVWFNAWRNDKDEALWASFALVFLRQLSNQIPMGRRLRANLTLSYRRLNLEKATVRIAFMLLFAICFILFIVVGFLHPELLLKPAGLGGFAPKIAQVSAVSLLLWSLAGAKRLLGNPLAKDLAKFVRNVDYADKLSFTEQFQEDFARIAHSYAGNGRIFVFIDDLDRAEVPRAAELMQAINLLLSADQPVPNAAGIVSKRGSNLFFLLGLDRSVVAAGIAAKNKESLPYLLSVRNSPADSNAAALDFGYDFLEKFIQVPFRVPEMDKERTGAFIHRSYREAPPQLTAPGLEAVRKLRMRLRVSDLEWVTIR